MPQAIPFVQILAELAADQPDRSAITCGALSVTRSELCAQANQMARIYEQNGVDFGDFVTIALPNSIEFYVSVVACWNIGAVPQPVSPQLPVAERNAIIELANPTLIVGVDPQQHPDRRCLPQGFEPPADTDDAPLPYRISPASKAPTSGGSTGRPKLIVSGQPASVNDRAELVGFGMDPDQTHLVAGPLYHNAPLMLSLLGLLMGQHLIVLPKFEAHKALKAIAAHRVNWVNLVPTMMLRMAREIERAPADFDLSSLQVVWHMAAPCADWLKLTWIDLIGPEKLFELYGGTEGQAATAITGTEWLNHRGSVGTPVMGEIIILDSDGQPLPPGEVGEIFMRPAAGTTTYRYVGAEARSRDGWESLGDIGWMDEDGFLYLSDRRTDMILSGGANVYPAEVENAIDSHPRVLSSAVVGLPDEDLGQRVHAFVQIQGQVAERDILEHVGALLARYKVPRSIEFVDTPLRDDAGKVRRSALRERAIASLGEELETLPGA